MVNWLVSSLLPAYEHRWRFICCLFPLHSSSSLQLQLQLPALLLTPNYQQKPHCISLTAFYQTICPFPLGAVLHVWQGLHTWRTAATRPCQHCSMNTSAAFFSTSELTCLNCKSPSLNDNNAHHSGGKHRLEEPLIIFHQCGWENWKPLSFYREQVQTGRWGDEERQRGQLSPGCHRNSFLIFNLSTGL